MFKNISPTPPSTYFWVDDLREKLWSDVSLTGMVERSRRLQSVVFSFVQVHRWVIQAVIEGELLDMGKTIRSGDFIELTGVPRVNDRAPEWFEVWVDALEVLSTREEWSASMNFARETWNKLSTDLDNRIVSLRNTREKAKFTLSHALSQSFRNFLAKERFTEIHSPKIWEKWAEWWSDVFKLDYFWEEATLAQSPQFYKQYMAAVYQRVFEIAPAFRAEKHATGRHLNEYTSFDVEIWGIDSYRDLMELETSLIKFMLDDLRANYSNELELLEVDVPDLSEWIPEITFDQAKTLIAKKSGKLIENPDDMEPEEERLLSKIVKEETGSDFVFITDFPRKKRPFYTMPNPENSDRTESFDLLFRGLEITTWWQRIHNLAQQKEAIGLKGLDTDDFDTFLELHRNGTIPHWGFAIWSERFLQQLLWLDNVRSASLFPRDRNRLKP